MLRAYFFKGLYRVIESECESKISPPQICIIFRWLFVPCYELEMWLSRLVSLTVYDLLHQEYFVIVICELRPIHIELPQTSKERFAVAFPLD